MLMLKKKVIKFMWAALFAYGYFGMTVFIFNNVAARSMITATVINSALIIVFLIEDKVGDYFMDKQKTKDPNVKQNIIMRGLKSYFNSVSFKTALYLFYIFILICSAIDNVDPDFFNQDFSLYLLTVEYGILVLIAVDTFLSQFFKDLVSR